LKAGIGGSLENKKIEVDISNQKLKLFENGKLVKEYNVETGHKEEPTPRGKFKIYNKYLMVYSRRYDCWLPFWMGFTLDGKYGFHELPICKEGRRGKDIFGNPISAGCVRLNVFDAEEFYKWAEIGVPVFIYGEEKSSKEFEKEKEWCHNFEIDLKPGDRSEEVRR
jgi:lipoprotein-anchoring transpeptidase ErfK/SrfK